MTGPVRLVIADDHPIVLRGLEDLLRAEGDIAVVAQCRDGDEVLAAVDAHRPHIALVDIGMPRTDGLEVLRRLKSKDTPTRVILMASAVSDQEMLEAARLGVAGVVLKEMPPKMFVQAIRKVHAGETWLERRAVARAFDTLLRREAGVRELGSLLSGRQLELVRHALRGLPNKALAEKLHVSEGTVKTHLHAIYSKLGVHRRTELIAYCRERGITPA